MIYLTTPPYATFHIKGTIFHFNIQIENSEREYYGIKQQIEAQMLGWA